MKLNSYQRQRLFPAGQQGRPRPQARDESEAVRAAAAAVADAVAQVAPEICCIEGWFSHSKVWLHAVVKWQALRRPGRLADR